MKKSVIAIGLAVFLCLSFWFGGFVQKQKNEQAREQSYEKLIGFAVHKIEALKTPRTKAIRWCWPAISMLQERFAAMGNCTTH